MSSTEKLNDTREKWLEAAIKMFRPMFENAAAALPEHVHVSVGFAYGARRENAQIMGQTWRKEASSDGVNHVFVSPELGDTYDVLETLLHELVHVADNCVSGHRGNFAAIATQIGFQKPMTFTPSGPALAAELLVIAEELGVYPHGALTPSVTPVTVPVVTTAGQPTVETVITKMHSGPGKQSARLVKVECPECGYIARVTRKWLDEVGAPICPKDLTAFKEA